MSDRVESVSVDLEKADGRQWDDDEVLYVTETWVYANIAVSFRFVLRSLRLWNEIAAVGNSFTSWNPRVSSVFVG